jgi:hypothetical protein
MKPTVAPRHTYGTLEANVTVANGSTIRVLKVSVYNGTGAPQKVSLQYGDGSSTYADIGVPSGQTVVYDVGFLADFGLRVASLGDANASVSVFHSNEGS